MGYEANFHPPLDHKYKCPVCLCALKDPIQTKCGHRLCSACFKSIRGGNWYFRCPIDNTWSNHVFEDNAAQREVLSLNVICNNETCKWNGELRELQSHLKNCEYEKIKCPNKCNIDIMRIDLLKHELECPQRLELCKHCNAQIIASQLAKHHVIECSKIPVICDKCGEVEVMRENMSSHKNAIYGDCPKIVVPCSFQHIGCMHQDQRVNMAKHYIDANTQHLMLLTNRIVDLETKNRIDIQICGTKMGDKLNEHREEFKKNVDKTEAIEKSLNETKHYLNELKNAVNEIRILMHSNQFMNHHQQNHLEIKETSQTVANTDLVKDTAVNTDNNHNNNIYEWKIALESKRKAYFSPTYSLPNSGNKIHLCLKPEVEIENDYYSTVCVMLESCDNKDELPVSFDCCFFLTDSRPTINLTNNTNTASASSNIAPAATASATNNETLSIIPKQLKSFVTTDPFYKCGYVSKPMVLYKSNGFSSFIVDNKINLEFTIREIKSVN